MLWDHLKVKRWARGDPGPCSETIWKLSGELEETQGRALRPSEKLSGELEETQGHALRPSEKLSGELEETQGRALRPSES